MPRLFKRTNKSSLPSAHSADQLPPLHQEESPRRFSAYDEPYCHPAHVQTPRPLDTLAPASPPRVDPSPSDSDRESRKRNIFTRSSAKNSLGILERGLSVRRPAHVEPDAQTEADTQMQDQRSPAAIHRSNTDSSLEKSYPQPRGLQPRPPSQQSLPPSPYPYEMSERQMAERGREQSQQRELKEPRDPRDSRETQKDKEDEAKEDVDVRGLVQKHDELQTKYSRVKRYYFEKEAQVQHLQNTVAHQRMAVSRTVLDDNEYGSRFNRLEGAIKDLSFSIRKDWKSIPAWLQGYVNDDAHTVGTKEMMAIGRAVISRWLVDEIFHRHFHPGLEPNLSIQLKGIEMNLRQQQVKAVTEEDKENAIAKISNWRRATFDGLGDTVQGKAAEDNRAQLTDRLIEKLVASLEMDLTDPPPAGLEGSARTIVENTIGIAEKIPLESRDVCIDYYPPGTVLNEALMKPEAGIPALTNVKEPPAEMEQAEDDSSSSTDGSPAKEKRKLFSWMGKKTSPGRSGKKDEGPTKQTIRFSSFLSAEVRGKGPTNVLMKAPVYVYAVE